MEAEAKDAMREVLGVRAMAQQEDVTPPTAEARQRPPGDEGWNGGGGGFGGRAERALNDYE